MSIKIEDSWKHLLEEEFNKDYFKQLISFVKVNIHPIYAIQKDLRYFQLLIIVQLMN